MKNKMNKITQICMLLLTTIAFAQGDYTINGTVKNYENGNFIIKIVDGSEEGKVLGKGKIKDGKFTAKGNLDVASAAGRITIDDTYEASVFIEPGNLVYVLNTKDIIAEDEFAKVLNITMSGASNVNLVQSFNTQKKIISDNAKYAKFNKAEAEMIKLENAGASQNAFKPYEAIYNEFFSIRQAEINALKKKLLLENPTSSGALYIVANDDLGVVQAGFKEADLEEMYANIDPRLKKEKDYKTIEQYVIAIRNTKLGAKAPAFSMENDKGGKTALSEFKGKYVLVDFWAYWCVPCVETFPHLNKLYSKYNKDGFEIINISQDPDRKPWFDALKKYKNPWPQVIEAEGTSMGNQVADLYNVEYLPTTYLLNKEGKIIGKNLTDEELDAKLKSLFGH